MPLRVSVFQRPTTASGLAVAAIAKAISIMLIASVILLPDARCCGRVIHHDAASIAQKAVDV
jgi:hypothetical protein